MSKEELQSKQKSLISRVEEFHDGLKKQLCAQIDAHKREILREISGMSKKFDFKETTESLLTSKQIGTVNHIQWIIENRHRRIKAGIEILQRSRLDPSMQASEVFNKDIDTMIHHLEKHLEGGYINSVEIDLDGYNPNCLIKNILRYANINFATDQTICFLC